MSKNSTRNSYSREFKLEAVKMSNQPDRTVADVARELDLREMIFITGEKWLKNWVIKHFPVKVENQMMKHLN